MDFASIKNSALPLIKSIFNLSSLWSKAKEALKLPYAKTYIAFSIFMVLVFLVVTFPYDMLIRSKLKDLEKGTLKTITVNELNFSLIDIIEMKGLYAMLRSGSEINVRTADIDISLLRLLIGKDVKGTVQLAGFKYDSGTSQIGMNMNGNIFLDYKTLTGIPQAGSCSIIIDKAMLRLSQINLPDSMGGLPLSLPPIRISSIKIDADITGGKLMIKNFRIFGADLNGSITGSISLQKNMMNSAFDLRLLLNADSPVLENYRNFFERYINDRNQLAIQLRGTPMMPRFEMPQGSDTEPGGGDHPIDNILPVQ
ncbi:MAG: type II secretion system protein GspN [Spirochaetes bacterium]|nr:type II secretion system protein GspN [Spirochaetota bacterium]